MKKFSIIIPVFNEEKYILDLLEGLKEIDYPKSNYEIILVNDNSTDNTLTLVKKHENIANIKIINSKHNNGRFISRLKGIKKANYENILLLDSRMIIKKGLLKKIDQIDAQAILGHSITRKGVETNIFEKFCSSIRRKVYKKYYQKRKKTYNLNKNNFDDYPKGLGIFYSKKNKLLDAYHKIQDNKYHEFISDDTKLLKILVQKTNILVSPQIKVSHRRKTGFYRNLVHLYNRGLKFTDYYLDFTKKKFWVIIFLPTILISVFLLFLFLKRFIVLPIFVVLYLFFIYWLTNPLSNSLTNYIKFFFIIPVVSITFYLGVIRGILKQIVNV
jgi:glycosyltransferase involved in cell wall biosynthesis